MRGKFDLSFERQKTVLILQFQAILGISGGACVFFARIMEELGYFGDEGIQKYDSLWRKRLNRYGVIEKLLRARSGDYLFHTEDLHLAMRELFGQGMELTFADFPVKQSDRVLESLQVRTQRECPLGQDWNRQVPPGWPDAGCGIDGHGNPEPSA